MTDIPEIGGLLHLRPYHRSKLEKEVITRSANNVRKYGAIEFRLNTEVGKGPLASSNCLARLRTTVFPSVWGALYLYEGAGFPG